MFRNTKSIASAHCCIPEASRDVAGVAGRIFPGFRPTERWGPPILDVANPQSSRLRDKSITSASMRNNAASSRRILGAVARHSLDVGTISERADMTTSNLEARYDAALRILHWAMAAIILTAIALGVIAALLPRGVSPRVELLTIHKSLGMTALVLVVLRVAWRLSVGAPPYSAALGVLSRLGAHAAHIALYALMIAMPVTGYVNSVAGGHPAPWFGLFDWPTLIARNDALAHRVGFVHYWLAWTIGAVLALHSPPPPGTPG